MLRGLISILTALAVLFACIPGQVLAADDFPASVYIGGTAETVQTAQMTREELCGRRFYYEQLKAPSKALYAAIADSGFARGPKLGSVTADLSDIPAEERTVTSRFTFTTGPDQRTYWNTEDGGLVYDEYIEPALAALTFDHPEFAWLDGTQSRWSWTTDYVPAARADAQTFVLTSLTYTMSETGYAQATTDCAQAAGSDKYDCADTQDLAALDRAIAGAKKEIGSLEGCSDSEILRNVHSWLCRNARYADKAGDRFRNAWRGYQTAHSALVQGVTVCSGYSKAFKLLSEAYGVPCVIVEGTSRGQDHMWNYVLVDGTWYGVDITWDDLDSEDAEETYAYFLRGSEDFGDHVEGCAWDRLPFTYPCISLSSYRASATDAGATRHFEFQAVDASDVPVAAMLAEQLETCHDRLEQDLDVSITATVRVKIYPDARAMEAEGFGTNNGTLAAVLCPNTDEIGILAARGEEEIAAQAQQAYAMAALRRNGVDTTTARTLSRGFALYEDGTAEDASSIRACLAEDSVPRLADLAGGFWSGEHLDAFCEAAVRYLADTYGFDSLLDVLRGRALSKALNRPMQEIEKQWVQFLRDTYLPRPGLMPGTAFEISRSESGEMLRGVQIGTLLSEVVSAFSVPNGTSVRVKGQVQTADAADRPAATGSQLVLTGADGKDTTLHVVVHGDVLGTGKMSLSQLVALTGAFAGTKPLEGAFLAAGDWSGTGRINLTDIVHQAELVKQAAA